MDALTVLLAISIGALLYIYVGYLLALRLIVGIRGAKPIRRSPITPAVTLVISAYNEAAVICKKIENALALDYPADRREILVISDASDDGTDGIVEEFAAQGVRLFRQTERRGKTAGLNAALPTVHGDIVVFSDANAMYREDALRMLVRNFADPEVGCATGEARYTVGDSDIADMGERVYWGYEMQIKRLETALGSMVGGDGAIYAIRKSLWKTLPDNAINDFLNPLQIVAEGGRAVYEPDAVCFEDTAGGTRAEYKRRVRIVSRSWRAVFQASAVLNPFRVGLFAWSVLSHKVLRWLSGLFSVTAVLTALGIYLEMVQRWPLASIVPLLLVTALLLSVRTVRRGVAMVGYFTVINAASLVGMVKGSLGHVSGVWAPPRSWAAQRSTDQGATIRVMSVLVVGALLLAAVISLVTFESPSAVIFWSSAGALAYVYLLYPALLALVRPYAQRTVAKADVQPKVCLFVPAHNEAPVLEAKLCNALGLDYPVEQLDIVVASDGSTDATNEIVRRFGPRVRLLEFSPRRGKMTVINEGLRAIGSDIVVFSDANTFLEPGAIRALMRNFADPTVGAVSGDVALVGDRAALGRSEDMYYLYERWVQQAESDIGSMIGADGALYAIRRELFVPPPGDTILDDMAIPMAVARMGRRVVFEPAARAYEQGSETALEEFSRKSRVVAGAMQLMTRRDSTLPLRAPQVIFSFLSHKALRWFSPAFATCAFISSLYLGDTSRLYALAAAAQALVYAGGVAGCYPVLRRIGVVAIAHYFCLVQAAAAVGFVRGVTGRQTVLWRRFERGTVMDDLSRAGSSHV
jgi:cellulose synthase/poly-beta-1,6-N-acetylglucosamine synthase-like glycosyltransferase